MLKAKIMIINEKQDTKIYHGDPGTIIVDPQSILNLFEQDAIPHLQVVGEIYIT